LRIISRHSSAARTTYHLRDDVLIGYTFLDYNALNKELVLAVVVLRDLLGRLHRNYRQSNNAR
jgi:hypothetical protein